MKLSALAAFAVAQLILAAQPAGAAGLDQISDVRTGTFAGARIRLALGGRPEDRGVRAGVTFAPTLHSQTLSGQSRTRFSEGVELGFAGGRPLTLSVSGRPVSHLLPGGQEPEVERRLGVSTMGYVAIGVGVAALVGGFILYQDLKDGSLTDCCE
jgi:hypothetical protein